MENCPHCGKELDPQRNLYRVTMAELPNFLLGWEWPSARRARKFTVRCPHCAQTYVSHTVRKFGFITYKGYPYVVALAFIVAVTIMLLASHKK